MIRIIAGKNGAGKTYSGVKYVVEQLKKGRLVFSDTPVFVEHKGKLLKTAVLTKLMLKNFSFPIGSLVFVNEGDAWYNGRAFKDFTAEDLIIFSQCRHVDIDLVIVAKRFGGLDLNIRSCCDEFVWSTRFPKSQILPPLFFRQEIYDSEVDFDKPSARFKPSVKWVFFSKKIARCYDTKFQRHILESRPLKDYKFWPDKEYIKPVTIKDKLFKKIVKAPTTFIPGSAQQGGETLIDFLINKRKKDCV